MKIYTKIIFGLDGQIKEEESYEYSGSVALCNGRTTATYTTGDIYWGPQSEHYAKVRPTGADFNSALVTPPDANFPYFIVVLTRAIGGATVTIDSSNLTVIRNT